MRELAKIAILISGAGTNMRAILSAIESGELEAEASFVGSDNPSAKGLKTAASLGVPTRIFSYKELGRERAEKAIIAAAEEARVDWIVLAGFMRILSPAFVRQFSGRIINIHPSLLPQFPGAHGIRDAWEAGVSETGVTIHIVDEEVDHGPILAQGKVKREADDTLEALEEKIHALEHELYKKTLQELFNKNPSKE